MIRHVVMWKLREPGAKKNAEIIRSKLIALAGVVPELKSCQVGINSGDDPGSFDAVLIADFADFAALDRYKVHPAHAAVSEFVKSVRVDRKTVDFEI